MDLKLRRVGSSYLFGILCFAGCCLIATAAVYTLESLLLALVSAVCGLACLASLLIGPLQGAFSSRRRRLNTRAMREAERGRRLAIHDKETGFLAPWYFRLRATEECSRSVRYEHLLSLLIIDANSGDRAQVDQWLSKRIRITDLVCRGIDGRYFLLLPEADEAAAEEVVSRLRADLRNIGVLTVSFPNEEARLLDDLRAVEVNWGGVV